MEDEYLNDCQVNKNNILSLSTQEKRRNWKTKNSIQTTISSPYETDTVLYNVYMYICFNYQLNLSLDSILSKVKHISITRLYNFFTVISTAILIKEPIAKRGDIILYFGISYPTLICIAYINTLSKHFELFCKTFRYSTKSINFKLKALYLSIYLFQAIEILIQIVPEKLNTLKITKYLSNLLKHFQKKSIILFNLHEQYTMHLLNLLK